jgi:hypothetical protein
VASYLDGFSVYVDAFIVTTAVSAAHFKNATALLCFSLRIMDHPAIKASVQFCDARPAALTGTVFVVMNFSTLITAP